MGTNDDEKLKSIILSLLLRECSVVEGKKIGAKKINSAQ